MVKVGRVKARFCVMILDDADFNVSDDKGDDLSHPLVSSGAFF